MAAQTKYSRESEALAASDLSFLQEACNVPEEKTAGTSIHRNFIDGRMLF